MNHLFTLTLMCLAMGLNAQLNYPWNPDENGDASIGSNDLLGFLTVYGEDFQPDPITIDSVDLFSVIQSLQNQLEALQGQVDSLSAVTSTTQGLSVLQGEDTISSQTQILQFTGSGVNVSTGDTMNEAVVNITGGGGGTTSYLYRVEYDSQDYPEFADAEDPSGTGVYTTSNTSYNIPNQGTTKVVDFTFTNESAPPISIIVYAFQRTFGGNAEQYRVSHIDAASQSVSFIVPVNTTLTTGLDGVSNSQYSTDLFSYGAPRNLLISLDLNNSFFDVDVVGANIHMYVEFVFMD